MDDSTDLWVAPEFGPVYLVSHCQGPCHRPRRHRESRSHIIAHYEVHERIGEGGLGQVFKARDKRLNRWVALKVLRPWARPYDGLQQQLIQEAQAASALNHPNIVTVHDVVTDEKGGCFIVMEYKSGKTLNAIVPKSGLPASEAIYYAIQIAEALWADSCCGWPPCVEGSEKILHRRKACFC